MTELRLDPGTVILAVDDEPLSLAVIRHMIEPDDVLLIEATSIAEAWELIDKNNAVTLDLILLDRRLPDGDGLDLLRRLRERPEMKYVPVIIQSGMSEPEDVEAAMRLGAFHYLAKPFKRNMLRALVRVAIKDSREQKYLLQQLARSDDGLNYLTEAEFEFRTPTDVKTLAVFLARFFPKPETAAIGASELMVNAIEHGNLEISYELKGDLLKRNEWHHEVSRRLGLPQYQNRKAWVRLSFLPDRIELLISDDGEGFDWRRYEQISEDRLFDLHGRGIALARQHCFDGLEFLGCGNQVRCWSWREPPKTA